MSVDTLEGEKGLRGKIADFLALEPHILGLFAAIFLITLGEQMWGEFFALYFEALGGTVLALGVFKSVSDTLDALLQLPGGMLSDKWGRLNAGISFVLFGIGGYFIYAVAPSWEVLFLGLIMVQGTSSLLQPTVFAIIGDSIPPERRTNAFSVQSILKRLPIVIAPMIGGFIFHALGIIEGVRISLWVTIGIGFVAVLILYWVRRLDLEQQNDYHENVDPRDNRSPMADDTRTEEELDIAPSEEDPSMTAPPDETSVSDVPRDTPEKSRLPRRLRALLAADIFARFGQAMVKALLILHVAEVVSLEKIGILIGFQMAIAILSYLPAAAIAERVGKRPVVMVTFFCFSVYPAAIVFSQSFVMLLIGYFIAGFREFGEPARKAMIVDRADPKTRGENVGLYYTIRSLSIVPASIIGAALWLYSPALAGVAAGLVGFTGLFVFSVFVRD